MDERIKAIIKKYERVHWMDDKGHDRNIGIGPEVRDAIRETCKVMAEIAKQPYSDEVAVIHGDEPSVIGKKIAQAILKAGGEQ